MSKNKKKIMIVVGSILAVAIIGFGGYTVKKQMTINEITSSIVKNAGVTDATQIEQIRGKVTENYKQIKKGYDDYKKQAKEAEAKAKNQKPAVPDIVVQENPVATIVVKDYGTMTFELFANDAPQTVYNFIELANSGFYNGLTFHRLISNFVIQGGDPEGTGAGGPGYAIQGEFPANGVANPNKHEFGTLAMARSQGNDTAGSQFYIVTGADGETLSDNYTAFGKITSGEDVLRALNAAPVEGEKPVPTITIESITVDTKGIDYPEPKKIK